MLNSVESSDFLSNLQKWLKSKMAAIFIRKMVIPAGQTLYISYDVVRRHIIRRNMFFEALVLLNYEIER